MNRNTSITLRRRPERRHAVALTSMLTAAALLSACGSSSGDTPAAAEPSPTAALQADFDAAMSTPTTLTFWNWVPGIETLTDLFMEEYPEIEVKVVNVGQGAEHYQQLRTALQAGQGAPDVAQMEYQMISSFRLGDDLLDLAPYTGDLSDRYPEWVWSQVTEGDQVWAVPFDTGPMGSLHRADLFEEAGIEVPATWEEFAEAAAVYREAKPDSFIANVPGNDAGHFVGLLWQSGARPFGYDGQETVRIDLMGEETQRVVSYWQKLIQDDLVSVDPDFTDQWYQGLASGRYASWQTAAWGPLFLQGTAADTSGAWRASPLPQWDEGEEVAGNWGGSTTAVMATTENPIAAAELARWISLEREPAILAATELFQFPPSTEILQDGSFLEQESEFYGGQQVNRVFAEIAETVQVDFQWLPFMDYAYQSFDETLGKAIADRGDMSASLQEWQDDLVRYAESQGFTVEK